MQLYAICPKCKDGDFHVQPGHHSMEKMLGLEGTISGMTLKCKSCKWVWGWDMVDARGKQSRIEKLEADK